MIDRDLLAMGSEEEMMISVLLKIGLLGVQLSGCQEKILSQVIFLVFFLSKSVHCENFTMEGAQITLDGLIAIMNLLKNCLLNCLLLLHESHCPLMMVLLFMTELHSMMILEE